MTDPASSIESHGPSAVVEPPIVATLGGDGRLSRGALAWSMFEGARNPFVILITIYVFMPYVSTTMVGDPVRGQELVSRYAQYSGWIVALTAPFLGASIDRMGPRKPWLLLVSAVLVAVHLALWWAKPDGTGLALGTVMMLTVISGLAFPYTEVLHNSLLVRAAGLKSAHKASGLALALGNFVALLALIFTAWAFALPGKVDWSWVPREPLFGLSAAAHEPERVVAPMAALIFAIGAIPLFLFTPDAPRTGASSLQALRGSAGELWRMVKGMGGFRDAATYLGARMFYVDGMTALLIYTGIYASGVMKWGPLQLLLYGIILSVLAVLGGFVGRWMDGAIGPKRSVQIAIGMCVVGLSLMLGTAPDRIVWLWSYDPAVNGRAWSGLFGTWPEVAFLLLGFSNAVFVTAQYASSRTLLTRLTPPDRTGAFFGVYALSGTATVWLGSFLVNFGTRLTHSQQGGFAAIILLLAVGFVGLLFVRGGERGVPGVAPIPH